MARECVALYRYRGDAGISQLKRDMEQILCCLRSKKKIVSFQWKLETTKDPVGALSLSIVLNTKKRQQVTIIASLLDESRKSSSKVISEKKFFYRMLINRFNRFGDIKRMIDGVINPYYQGFKAEDVAEEILAKKSSRIIQEFRRGDSEEDNKGIDFAIKGYWQGKTFEFSFDLKTGRTGQEQAKKRHGHTPTILMRLEDLEKRPFKFIKKVEKLALMIFQKDFLGKRFDRYAFHI